MKTIQFEVNGDLVSVAIREDWTLLQVLNEELNLRGAKEGCGQGECGACTVILDGVAVDSCLYPALEAEGKRITTIEGLITESGSLHPIQKAFVDNGAVQCGFCTPGMILSAKALLDKTPKPTDLQVKRALAGNLCRCTGYHQIIKAVLAASEEMSK